MSLLTDVVFRVVVIISTSKKQHFEISDLDSTREPESPRVSRIASQDKQPILIENTQRMWMSKLCDANGI